MIKQRDRQYLACNPLPCKDYQYLGTHNEAKVHKSQHVYTYPSTCIHVHVNHVYMYMYTCTIHCDLV